MALLNVCSVVLALGLRGIDPHLGALESEACLLCNGLLGLMLQCSLFEPDLELLPGAAWVAVLLVDPALFEDLLYNAIQFDFHLSKVSLLGDYHLYTASFSP